jgi:hypothetical protein
MRCVCIVLMLSVYSAMRTPHNTSCFFHQHDGLFQFADLLLVRGWACVVACAAQAFVTDVVQGRYYCCAA